MASLVTPVAKRPRIVISNAQKKALRTWYYSPSIKKTLTDASVWQYSEYRYTLSSLTASDILSNKNKHLDSDLINLKSKSSRTVKQDILEMALSDQALRFDQAHSVITRDLLRLKATEFWQKLPEYQGLEYLSQSKGWLARFKSRFNFRQYRKAREVSSITITEDILSQISQI